jgi:two-component sensor histidine kinase
MDSELHYVGQLSVQNEDRLLLTETVHRVANEAASALAAIHLAKAAKGGRARAVLLERAAARLEGFAAVNSALAIAFDRPVDVGSLIRIVVMATAAGRGSRGGEVYVDLPEVELEQGQARRLVLISYELVSNAMRHVVDSRGGRLHVTLHHDADEMRLEVADDGPGVEQVSLNPGTGVGSRLVAELVRRAGGTLECQSTSAGTVFRVRIPRRLPATSLGNHRDGAGRSRRS